MKHPQSISRIAASIACVLALTAPIRSQAAETPSAASAIAPAIDDYPAIEVTEGTYVIHGPIALPNPHNQGFMNNPGFIIGTDGVIVVDPGSSLQVGEMVLRSIKRFTDLPVVAVFNTHHHGDHWLGNHAFINAYPEAKIYGHPRMIERVKQGAGDTWVGLMNLMTESATQGTKVHAPTIALQDGDTVQHAGLTIRAHHPQTGLKAHTDGDLMFEVPERSIVFLGDNVLSQRIARVEDGHVAGNIAAIDEILRIDAQHWVPGHGPTGSKEIPQKYHEYLSLLHERIKQAYAADADMSSLKAIVEEATKGFATWTGYEDQVGKHAQQTWMETEAASF